MYNVKRILIKFLTSLTCGKKDERIKKKIRKNETYKIVNKLFLLLQVKQKLTI